MSFEVQRGNPRCGLPLCNISPLAISATAATLLEHKVCTVSSRHRQGASLSIPGSPDLVYVSAPGQGLLPLHVIVAHHQLAQILEQEPEVDAGANGSPGWSFALAGVKRFTVRIHPDPEGMRLRRTATAVEAMALWLCAQPLDANGLGQPAATVLAAGNRWQRVFEPALGHGEDAVLSLLGRGSGTTPAGDDFLVGALAYAWAREGRQAGIIKRVGALEDEFAKVTTATSATYLRAALQGLFSSHLVSFARALPRAGWEEILLRAERITGHGSTSGFDTLTGFLAAARFESRPLR